MNETAPNIAVIGGGTGSFTLLQELKIITPDISAIVNMCDDGGSTGVLRDELGGLPPGDIRQCLVALSDVPDARDLFAYRFDKDKGIFSNQSLGNIILSGLELQYGCFAEAVKVASRILHITGQVLPVSLDNHTLVMQDGDEIVQGEYRITQRPIKHVDARVYLEPPAVINPEAEAAIAEADLVVISPGNLYSSLLPALAVGGMSEALKSTGAPIVAVANLVNKPGQTDNWHVVDYVHQLERSIGEHEIDYVLYNDEPPTPEMLGRYAADGEFPVSTEASRFSEVFAKAIGSYLVAKEAIVQDPNDTIIKRTLIRHDAAEVGSQLLQIFNESHRLRIMRRN